jgi:AcrR family transcriptional regulator
MDNPKHEQDRKLERMDGFARRREQSRHRIRQAAWELFSQFGVEKVSIADIARKAGVSPATIYNNFDSKEALAHEFIATTIDQLISRVQTALIPDRPYKAKMTDFVQFLSDMIAHQEPSAVARIVFTTSLDLENDPEIKTIRDLAHERMADLLLGLVQEGQEQGQVDPDLSTEALRIYLKAFMNVFIDPRLQYRFASDPKLVSDLGLLMIYGLGAQST